MKNLIPILLLVLLPLVHFAQTSNQGAPLTDKQKIDLLWTHTKGYNDPNRYKVLNQYFTLSGVAEVTTGIDNNDCDSSFNVTLDSASKLAVNKLVQRNPAIKPTLKTGIVHVEISCAANSNCEKPNECAGFNYPFPRPMVPADGAKVTITGSLVIEMHQKYVLELHPVSEIKTN